MLQFVPDHLRNKYVNMQSKITFCNKIVSDRYKAQ